MIYKSKPNDKELGSFSWLDIDYSPNVATPLKFSSSTFETSMSQASDHEQLPYGDRIILAIEAT